MNLNQLKVDEIEEIFHKIYENACELLEEAEILYAHNRYSRAYLCAHIAFEEFGKLPMLNTVAIHVHNGLKIDWKALNKRIRSHHSKISQSWGTMIAFRKILEDYQDSSNPGRTSLEENDEGHNFIEKFKLYLETDEKFSPIYFMKYLTNLEVHKNYKEKYSMTMLLNEFKNGSLYADYDNKKFIKPSEKIDKDICEFGIVNALVQKKFIEMPNIHKDGFRLNRLTGEEMQWIESMSNKFMEQIKEEFKGK